jgi:hypothetical protein
LSFRKAQFVNFEDRKTAQFVIPRNEESPQETRHRLALNAKFGISILRSYFLLSAVSFMPNPGIKGCHFDQG